LLDDIFASPRNASRGDVLAALEIQLALMDALKARVTAAHLSAAVEHLRLDLLADRLDLHRSWQARLVASGRVRRTRQRARILRTSQPGLPKTDRVAAQSRRFRRSRDGSL
jgi:hypothetical protein